jgi:hypothetical protein
MNLFFNISFIFKYLLIINFDFNQWINRKLKLCFMAFFINNL